MQDVASGSSDTKNNNNEPRVVVQHKHRLLFESQLKKFGVDATLSEIVADGLAVLTAARGMTVTIKKHVLQEAKHMAALLRCTAVSYVKESNQMPLHLQTSYAMRQFVGALLQFVVRSMLLERQQQHSLPSSSSSRNKRTVSTKTDSAHHLKDVLEHMMQNGFTYVLVAELMVAATSNGDEAAAANFANATPSLLRVLRTIGVEHASIIELAQSKWPEEQHRASTYRLGATFIRAVLERCPEKRNLHSASVEEVQRMGDVVRALLNAESDKLSLSDMCVLVERPEPSVFAVRVADVEKIVERFNNRLSASQLREEVDKIQKTMLTSLEWMQTRREHGDVAASMHMQHLHPALFEDAHSLAAEILNNLVSPVIVLDEIFIRELIDTKKVEIESEHEKYLWQRLIHKKREEEALVKGSYDVYMSNYQAKKNDEKNKQQLNQEPASAAAAVLMDCLTLIPRPNILLM